MALVCWFYNVLYLQCRWRIRQGRKPPLIFSFLTLYKSKFRQCFISDLICLSTSLIARTKFCTENMSPVLYNKIFRLKGERADNSILYWFLNYKCSFNERGFPREPYEELEWGSTLMHQDEIEWRWYQWYWQQHRTGYLNTKHLIWYRLSDIYGSCVSYG